MKDKNGVNTWWYVRYPAHVCDHHHRTAEAAERCGKRNADSNGHYEVARETVGG